MNYPTLLARDFYFARVETETSPPFTHITGRFGTRGIPKAPFIYFCDIPFHIPVTTRLYTLMTRNHASRPTAIPTFASRIKHIRYIKR